MQSAKVRLRLGRKRRIRKRLSGTSLRPRLSIHRSLKNFSAQLIDDTKDRVLFSLSTFDKEIKEKFPYGGNIKAAEFFGEVFARRAKDKGISRIIFDRSGYLYHGRLKAFADKIREGGLEF